MEAKKLNHFFLWVGSLKYKVRFLDNLKITFRIEFILIGKL
jgi:hypothetical protein